MGQLHIQLAKEEQEKTAEYFLYDEFNKRYRAKRGWTTQKQYAKRFIEEDAKEQIKIAYASSATLLKMIPVEEGNSNGKE